MRLSSGENEERRAQIGNLTRDNIQIVIEESRNVLQTRKDLPGRSESSLKGTGHESKVRRVIL